MTNCITVSQFVIINYPVKKWTEMQNKVARVASEPAIDFSEVLASLEARGVEFDTSSRRLSEYSYDASNYRVRPAAVVFAKSSDELRETLRACHAAAVPVTMRGGGTSMAGNAVGEGVVVNLSRRLHRIGDLDFEGRSVWADAGVVLGELRTAVERQSGGDLTFAPDPSSVSRATVGGSLGNDACGNHSVEYGRMTHHVSEIELLTVDGAHLVAGERGVRARDSDDAYSVLRAEQITERLKRLVGTQLSVIRTELGMIPRQVSGYHLSELLPENGFNVARALVGSEGTCAVVVRARLRLVAKPKAVALLCVGYDSTVDSARDVTAVLQDKPSAVEGLDSSIVEIMRHRRGEHSVSSLPAGKAYVMIEFTGDTIEAAAERCVRLAEKLRNAGRLRDHTVVVEAAERARLWRVREDGAGLSSKRIDGVQTWPGWEDSAVAPENLADYLSELLPMIERYGYTASLYGHFGAGCVHMRIDFDLRSEAGRAAFDGFMREAAELVVSHGGSLSGEHGDGRARGSLLAVMYSDTMIRLFAAFKEVWDPGNLLNPGIIVEPRPFVENLALAELPAPGELFVGNSHACIGVGRCRATSGGFMCPSYRATKDEKNSTRGRARVLQELVRSRGTSAGGLKSPEVREALDLCLSCKACSSDCPTGVDIAEAKSELLDDHYRGRVRPFTHYSIGWLPRWLPLLTRISALANAGARIGALRWIADRLGVSARRKLPGFVPHRTLAQRLHEAEFSEQGEMLVFADSFTRAFRPEVIPAAARVLRSSGASVGCSPEACCGLTWISTGQRAAAAKRLARLVSVLDDGTERRIVVLEPSCAAAIRDEAPKLVGGDAASRVAARVRSFAGAIDELMTHGWRPSTPAPQRVVVQTHCHEHAVFGPQAQKRILETWGVPAVVESSSCCGVAGNFGFESAHFDVSMSVAQHSIVPAMRNGGDDAVVLTDGFSCAMQVMQLDPTRGSTHLATALDAGLEES